MIDFDTDVAIIGAGPAGAVAAAILCNRGHRVTILERETFPRFSIGESLLPQSMVFMEEAGLLDAVKAAGFQRKTGAAFRRRERHFAFDFSRKFSEGPGETFQVQRANFDKVLADGAAEKGADIRYRSTVTAFTKTETGVRIDYRNEAGADQVLTARFCLDASGFGRVLPRLLDLETPTGFPTRQAVFCHFENITRPDDMEWEKILIVVHPENFEIWYWVIPFSDGTASVGVVGTAEEIAAHGTTENEIQTALLNADPYLANLFVGARRRFDARTLIGYSANVKSLVGPGYALLGNAGEFLDPVFSSGVTIALRSAALAADVLDRDLRGETVDWERDFGEELKYGVDTFRDYVETWYSGELQDIIFFERPQETFVEKICAVLAGYAWDRLNPFVNQSRQRLTTLAKVCKGELG